MKLITSAQFVGYNPRKDKSISLRFETGEKAPADMAGIHSMLDCFGYLHFKAEEQLTKAEIEQLDELETDLYDNPKTQSQRLRNVLYRNWEHDNKGHEKFKDFYKSETERIIEHYKGKLPEDR